MLKKINRISREVEIKEVLDKGKYLHTDIFMRKFIVKNEGKKFLIIVSKKVAKLAVERNRMKRLAYEVIYNNLEKLPEGIRMVLMIKKTYEKIGDEIVSGL